MSLSLYKPLGDNSEVVRLSAAKSLSTELTTLLTSPFTEPSKISVDYALKRLTRGLASGRDSARPGFAIVLTEFLTTLHSTPETAQKWGISLDDVLSTIVKNTTPPGHSTGQEERDSWLGRLFGLQSLVQSNILFSSTTSLETYPAVLDRLFEVATKKPWLTESSAWTIAASVPRWPAATAKGAAEVTYQKLVSSGFAKSGEGVGIWLALRTHWPEVVPAKDVWSKGMPLSGNLATLAKVLKESGAKEEGTKTKGSWNPRLGFVWESVLDIYFSPSPAAKAVRKGNHPVAEWAEFWRVVVDESLFSSASSEERKFWGFLFFLKSLDRISTPQDLSAIFSKNFTRCLINQLSDSERYLNKAASKTSRALIAKAESAPWTAPVIFKHLVASYGTPNFDHLTKTKTVDKVMCAADESGLLEIVGELRSVISNPLSSSPEVEDAARVAEVRRQWAADQILSAIRNGKTVKAVSWLSEVLKLFVTFGYFDVVDKKRPVAVAVSAASQNMFKARLMSCLTYLISLKRDEDSSSSWPYVAVRTIAELAEKTGSYKFAVEVDEEILEALGKAKRNVEKLRKKRAASPGDSQLLSFELLYSLIILQVYNGESDALSVLEDLQSIQKKILKSGSKKQKKKKKEGGEEDEEMEIDPSEVLVDILLSFLSKPSMLLKRLTQTVFTSFSASITRAGLERCFEVLETKEGLDGQASLFDDEDDEEGEEEAIEDDEELDSDVEMLSNPPSSSDEEDSDIEILSNDDDDDDDDDNDEEVRKLEAALQTVLSAPTGEASEDEADLDDDAMLELDAQISSIFAKRKQAASKKSQERSAKELVVNFKTKVLELLEAFTKSSPHSPLALEILLPCLVLARSSRDTKLQERALNVVRAFAHNSKREGLPVLAEKGDVDRAWELLGFVHEEATRGGAKGRRAACSSASILTVKALVTADKDAIERVAGVYAATMVRWVKEPKMGIDNGFFSDFVGWAGSVRGKLGKEEEKEATVEVKGKKGKGKKGKGEKRKAEEVEDEEQGEEQVKETKIKAVNGGKSKKRRRGKGGKN